MKKTAALFLVFLGVLGLTGCQNDSPSSFPKGTKYYYLVNDVLYKTCPANGTISYGDYAWNYWECWYFKDGKLIKETSPKQSDRTIEITVEYVTDSFAVPINTGDTNYNYYGKDMNYTATKDMLVTLQVWSSSTKNLVMYSEAYAKKNKIEIK